MALISYAEALEKIAVDFHVLNVGRGPPWFSGMRIDEPYTAEELRKKREYLENFLKPDEAAEFVRGKLSGLEDRCEIEIPEPKLCGSAENIGTKNATIYVPDNYVVSVKLKKGNQVIEQKYYLDSHPSPNNEGRIWNLRSEIDIEGILNGFRVMERKPFRAYSAIEIVSVEVCTIDAVVGDTSESSETQKHDSNINSAQEVIPNVVRQKFEERGVDRIVHNGLIYTKHDSSDGRPQTYSVRRNAGTELQQILGIEIIKNYLTRIKELQGKVVKPEDLNPTLTLQGGYYRVPGHHMLLQLYDSNQVPEHGPNTIKVCLCQPGYPLGMYGRASPNSIATIATIQYQEPKGK
ncbi:hypothetical protein J4206_03470 [Candidatus Woesearchaeota archaeon]|nr:hypothetical protein [Candidatus Woesearchaeota archaeon]